MLISNLLGVFLQLEYYLLRVHGSALVNLEPTHLQAGVVGWTEACGELVLSQYLFGQNARSFELVRLFLHLLGVGLGVGQE